VSFDRRINEVFSNGAIIARHRSTEPADGIVAHTARRWRGHRHRVLVVSGRVADDCSRGADRRPSSAYRD
jgi:hypothetical protein